jgi:hypothetical protein
MEYKLEVRQKFQNIPPILGKGGVAVKLSDEVEYRNLEIRFDRRKIHDLIRELIQAGYSLFWSEANGMFLVSVRTGRRLVRLRFRRVRNGYKLIGDYTIRDPGLSELLERMINDSRGHAVVKRIKDRRIVIEDILFGEIVRLVEVSGMDHRVVYQRNTTVTTEEMIRAFQNRRAEERVRVLRLELDYELAVLHEALAEGRTADAEASKKRLMEMRAEMLELEM